MAGTAERAARILKRPLLALYDALIFRKIRANFGGRLQFIIGGGALLDIELQRFFYAIGMPMLQGYGLTEAAPVISANTLAHHKLGSSGRIVPGMEVRICGPDGQALPRGARGEIVVRGENVMAGYWKNERATAEVLRDGWLYTGDLGYLDERRVSLRPRPREEPAHRGRRREVQPRADRGGHHRAARRTSSRSMLYNNQSPYTTALLVPSREGLRGWLTKQACRRRLRRARRRCFGCSSRNWRATARAATSAGHSPDAGCPRRSRCSARGSTEQNHMLNSTMKMVRGKIVEFYRTRIDYLYTAEGRSILNARNRAIIARLE